MPGPKFWRTVADERPARLGPSRWPELLAGERRGWIWQLGGIAGSQTLARRVQDQLRAKRKAA